MGRRTRSRHKAEAAPQPGAAPSPPPSRAEAPGAAAAAALLAAAVFLAPAIGVPGEYMLQDTLKSVVVAFAAVASAALLAWSLRRSTEVRWHAVLWLPLLLAVYAAGSMAWSHAYLAGVEAARWLVFATLLFVGLNVVTRERLPWIALGVHAGAAVAALWAALQFWFDLRLFPQGPGPASTFVNRNFLAEFLVCTLPFSALLLARARASAAVAVLAATTSLTLLALLMTGTRSALITALLLIAVVLPVAAWRCRGDLALRNWPTATRVLAVAVLVGGTLAGGMVPTGNDRIAREGRGVTPLERAVSRATSISAEDGSINLRLAMWKATARMVGDQPLTGVGAGAWEVYLPLYQAPGAEVEIDFYAHNEVLQLLAEYGVVGLAFIGLLGAYLVHAGWRTWRLPPEAGSERPWRAAALASLLALLLVGNAGFPWRMAATGALFALALAIVAGSDSRLPTPARLQRALRWGPVQVRTSLALVGLAAAVAAYLAHVATGSERRLVEAARLALAISAAPDRDQPRWSADKAEVVALATEGIALNPHYRKITPQIADELAAWGDWKNATWIWESVVQSRPYVVAILTNVARGHMQLGDLDRARAYLERARKVSADSASVLSLEVILLVRAGQERRAAELAEAAIDRGRFDVDLLRHAFVLGWRTGHRDLVERSAATIVERYPAARADALAELADFHDRALKDPDLALQTWRRALEAGGPARRAELLGRMPAGQRERLQTSASSS